MKIIKCCTVYLSGETHGHTPFSNILFRKPTVTASVSCNSHNGFIAKTYRHIGTPQGIMRTFS